jgi:hypothetical protein
MDILNSELSGASATRTRLALSALHRNPAKLRLGRHDSVAIPLRRSAFTLGRLAEPLVSRTILFARVAITVARVAVPVVRVAMPVTRAAISTAEATIPLAGP